MSPTTSTDYWVNVSESGFDCYDTVTIDVNPEVIVSASTISNNTFLIVIILFLIVMTLPLIVIIFSL